MMRKRKIVRIISLLLLVLFVLPLNVFASTIPSSDALLNYQSEQRDSEIQSLLDERARLLSICFNANSAKTKDTLNLEISKIDELLVGHGADFLTEAEAMKLIAEKEESAEHLSTANSTKEDVPTSSNNTWISTRSSYTYQGVRHNIQTLTAQPKNANSALATTGLKTITYTNKWLAGAQNMLLSSAESISGYLIDQIPGASLALAFVDAFGAFNSAFTDTALVDVDGIQYSWSAVVTASFKYVRLENEDDSAQWLSLVSTKASVSVGYQTPGFSFVENGQTYTVTPEVAQGSRTINATPSNYGSNNLAVKSYYTYGGGSRQECVRSVSISGPESKSIQNIALCCPFFPSQCE